MPFIIERNDITLMHVDAIVNAANNTLLGGGGVDGAIHRAAGRGLYEECLTLGGCETGRAKVTAGYLLPAKYVIHTVGPIWRGGKCGEEELLRSCYRESLRLAVKLECESLAFPLISAGAYGYPKREAMLVAREEISAFLEEHDMTVYLVIFDRGSFRLGSDIFGELKSYVDENYCDIHADPDYYRRRRYELAKQSAAKPKPHLTENCLTTGAYAPQAVEAMPQASYAPVCDSCMDEHKEESAEGIVFDLDESFSQNLMRRIIASGMTDAECYKRANIDRKLFSKIRNDVHYRPSKPTALAFAIALRLDLENTEDLLRRAGFAISHAYKFDVIVEYFIKNGRYDIFEINEALFEYDQPLLGG